MALTLEKLREILCRHDASLPTLCANEVLQAAAEAPTYPLPDSLYPDSKDWAASNYAGRVEWLHVMYESAKRTIAMLDGAPAAAEAQAVNTSESYERMRRALTIIANWTLPETGEYWDKERTRPVSYEAEHGSNGVRDYMKNLAAQTLLATPTDSAVNAGAVPKSFAAWWRDVGQFIRIKAAEPADGEFEQAIARASWKAALATKADSSEPKAEGVRIRLCRHPETGEVLRADDHSPASPASAQLGEVEEIAAALEKDKWHVSAVDLQRAADMLRTLASQSQADSVAPHKSTDLSDNARSASEVSDKADSTDPTMRIGALGTFGRIDTDSASAQVGEVVEAIRAATFRFHPSTNGWTEAVLAALSTAQPKADTLPSIHAEFETSSERITGTTAAPVKRVERNDDGSLTVVIDYWPHPDAIDLAPGIERMEQTRNAYEGGKLLAQAAGAMHTDPDPSGDNPWHDKPKADSTEAPAVSDDKTDHEWVEFCRPFVYMNGSHEMPNYPGICRAVLALRPKAQPLTDEQIVNALEAYGLILAYRDYDHDIACARAIEAAHGIASSTKEGGNG